MNHPYALLADLMDGTLDADDRARVEAHLEECSTCRDELASATIGRREARSLPQETAPADLHRRVVDRAGGGRGDAVTHRGPPGWFRWAGVAAAAAILAAIAIALPDIGGEGADQRAAGGAGAEVTAPGGESAETLAGDGVPLEVRNQDYDAQALERLAREAAGDRAAMATSDAATRNSPAAFRCVRSAFEEQPSGRLTRLIQARFEGRAAYIAVYLEGPGANQPPDAGTVWVAARDDCTILSFAQARL